MSEQELITEPSMHKRHYETLKRIADECKSEPPLYQSSIQIALCWVADACRTDAMIAADADETKHWQAWRDWHNTRAAAMQERAQQ